MNNTVSTWIRRVVDESGATEDQPTAYAASRDETVATIMTHTTYCVRPEVGTETLATLLLDHRMSGVPVVNDSGRPIGVVSKTDLLRHLHEHGDAPARVKDIMMPMVFAVERDTPIVHAAALMAGEGVHRLAVVDADLTIIGIVSALDVVRWVADRAGYSV